VSSQPTARRVSRIAPARRPTRRKPVKRRLRTSWRTRVIFLSAAVVAVLVGWAILARAFAPVGNTARFRFDAIIVLGTSADAEGNPTPAQLARVTEAVHEYERGVAPRLIVTGGAATNDTVEARVMARTAEAMGVPASSIYQEAEALNTIQNACYAVRIMKAHGWGSAEVVSAASHLPRAGLIFSRTGIEWRTHAAPPLEPETGFAHESTATMEVLKTVRYLVYARWADRCG
jgi:uncharacterized SAM-binding protein YcdF (DUF218 family)